MSKTWCEQAKTAQKDIKRMEEDNLPLDFDLALKCMLADYMCERHLDKVKWKQYHKEMENAIFPEQFKDELTEHYAKTWVNEMYHKTQTGAKVKGEHWDISTTTSVGEQHNIDFSEVTKPEFYAVLNMMWHDHYNSAVLAKMEETPAFYIALAKDFLFDDDGKSPHERVLNYYNYIA